jgi:hypothetical protein
MKIKSPAATTGVDLEGGTAGGAGLAPKPNNGFIPGGGAAFAFAI